MVSAKAQVVAETVPTPADLAKTIAELRQVAEHYGPKDEMVWPRVTRAIHLLEQLHAIAT